MILDWLDLLTNPFGKISDFFSKLVSRITGFFDTIKQVGEKTDNADAVSSIVEMGEKFKTFVNEKSQEFLGMADKDATLATTQMKANLSLDKVFKPLAAENGLDDAAAAQLQAIGTETVTEYLSEGIPSLDKYNKPTTAILAAQSAAEKYRALLLGDGAGDIGLLRATRPELVNDPAKCEAIASRMIHYLTGLTANADGGYDVAALEAERPKNGLAGMFLSVQLKKNSEGFEKGDLTAADINLSLDKNALVDGKAKAQADKLVAKNGVSGGTPASEGEDKVPSPGGAKNNSLTKSPVKIT